MLKKAGLVDFITNFVNKLMLETSDKLYESTIVPLFGLWPAIWSMIPDEDFEEGYNYIFNDVLARTGADYSGIKEKIEHYNESVRSRREEILNGINENCNLYVIARYGYSSIPLSSAWATMTDGVLHHSARPARITTFFTFSMKKMSLFHPTVRLTPQPACSPNRPGSYATPRTHSSMTRYMTL